MKMEFPQSHLENIDTSKLENQSLEEVSRQIGQRCFSIYVEKSPGILRGFKELSETGGSKEFAEVYSKFVTNPEVLREKNVELYNFIRDRVFFGREYLNQPIKQNFSYEISFGRAKEEIENDIKNAKNDVEYYSKQLANAAEFEAQGGVGTLKSTWKAHLQDAKNRLSDLLNEKPDDDKK